MCMWVLHAKSESHLNTGLVSEHLAIASVLWNNDSRPVIK